MTEPSRELARLKILRIIARLNIGGPARHVILLNRGLDARGHQTLLVHGSLDYEEASLEHLAVDSGIRTVKLPELGRRVSPLSDVRAFLRLLTVTLRETPDVIHTHTAKAGALGRLVALAVNLTRSRRRRCLVVHTFHGHVLEGYFGPALSAAIRITERTLSWITDRIVTISGLQRRDIAERFAIAAPSKTVVIPLGLDLVRLLQLSASAPSYRAELRIEPDGIVVGYVGRFVPIKDLGMLVLAFSKALLVQKDLWLLLAGNGPARDDVESVASRAGVLHRLRFLGWTEDLPRLYATLDICALSSLNEGTPVAIIEAMAAARPVAAAAVGGVPDLVEDGVTGLLVPPRDSDALAAAIIRLAAHPEERDKFGSAARQRVATRYSHERLIDDIEHLYLSALAGKRKVQLNTKVSSPASSSCQTNHRS